MARTKGKMRSVAEMRALISAQEESGKSIKTFCQEQGIGIWIFSYWRRRLRDLDKKSRVRSTLAEVKIAKDHPGKKSLGNDLKVTVHEDFEVSIPADFDVEHLKALLLVPKSC